jgi:L-lysine 2,3-aminomutase
MAMKQLAISHIQPLQIHSKVPKVPRKLFEKLENDLREIMDNKVVVVFH